MTPERRVQLVKELRDTLDEISEAIMAKKEPKGVNPTQAPQRAALERMVRVAKELVQAEIALLEALALPNDKASPEDWDEMVLVKLNGEHEEPLTPANAVLATTQKLLTYF